MKHLLYTAWLCVLPVQASPELHLSSLYAYLAPGRASLVKPLENQGAHTAFVRVELAEIHYSSSGEPAEQPLPSEGLQRALLATPSQFIVPAGGFYNVRLVFRGERKQERYFRVRFMPVVPAPGDAFALQGEQAEAYRASLGTGVQVLKALGALLVVRPQDERYATRIAQEGTAVVVENHGNATLVLDNVRHCPGAAATCSLGARQHVRPGQRAQLPLLAGQPLHFELIEGKVRSEKVFAL